MSQKILSVIAAFFFAFVVVNFLLMFYERPLAWIDTPNGASLAVRHPNAILVHGTEGYGISTMDDNGYTNPNYPLDDEYILMIGASHSQGKEISESYRYSYLVNSQLANGTDRLSAYNISCDGYFLPQIINQFRSAVTLYPHAKCITIEIGGTDYPADTLIESCNQPSQVDMRSAKELFAELPLKSKFKNIVKEYFPILSIIKTHIGTKRNAETSPDSSILDSDEYRKAIESCLSLIRSEYEGPIVFVYHPETIVVPDGHLEIERSSTFDTFMDICNKVGIDCIDVGDDFLKSYNENYQLPYGFSNTSAGSGHLNKTGHAIIGNAIIKYLREEGLL